MKVAISLDIGASNLRAAIVSQEGKILKKVSEKTRKEGKSGTVITNQVIKLIESLLQKESLKKIAGIGISSIGPLDYKKGGILNTPNVPFKFIPLVKPLEKRFSMPVFLLNDCNAAVWGEKHFGAGKKINNLVYITISTGIGGGAIVDGKLLFGKGGNAVEIGHSIIDTKYNFLCSCKKGKGHWEAYSSGRNLPRFFKFWLRKKKLKLNFKIKEAKDIFDLAKRGEKIAKKFIFEEIGKINARGVSNIIVAYDPELITLGGSVVLNNPDLILSPIKKYIDHFLKLPKIQITPLKEDVTLLGAGAAVFFQPK